MTLPVFALGMVAVLVLGYSLYGRFIARRLALDDAHATPAVQLNDGMDFVPTRPFYLLGQHFSAIAAAGPIVGPIAACLVFGWLPCMLWIGLGVIFIGAVHDFSALVASVRHEARSIAEIVRRGIGRRGWMAIMAFIWLALLYVIVAFTDVTAATFTGVTGELEGLQFNAGGAVAASSTMYLFLALLMGLLQRVWKPRLWLLTAIFVPATLGVVYLGTKVSTLLVLPHTTWGVIILAYCLVASILPVWSLLQSRGYLGGFVLYLALAVGLIGILFGGHSIQQPAFKQWTGPAMTDSLFPFLFVTIACGACSGFHGLVCSGTTSKQIEKESHCRPIGYGGMLLEGLVAVIALSTVMIVAPGTTLPGPGKIYGDGIGRFMTTITGPNSLAFATTFGAMAFSTFVFDTLDVATRLGRLILQELFGAKGRVAAVIATMATLAMPLLLIAGAPAPAPGQKAAWTLYWTLFGTSNQLLAALTLLAVTVWLKRTGRPVWFTALPMAFVMTLTVWSLFIQIGHALSLPLSLSAASVNGFVAILLVLLALLLVIESARALIRPPAWVGSEANRG
ncbi:MAG: carbon starvation protein A [Nitrospirae bacterium]|nr:carbon starvation protein A [Nitrospirota bacterium]